MKLSSNLKALIELFRQNGYQIYLVGGCVRDLLMDIEPNDYDLTTDARPDQMKEMNSSFRVIPTGEKYGTITFIVNGETFEVTTFRNDYDYTDSRRPAVVKFSDDLVNDLKRRDFTINAIAYDAEHEKLIDPFGGAEDIRCGIVRTVGNPVERFDEDYLRIIRGYRFSYVYNFKIERNTRRAMRNMIGNINQISNERIQAELTKIFSCPNYEHLENISVLLFELLPILKECYICEQNNPFHYTDVYHHSLDAITSLKKFTLSRDELLVCSLSLLLHDVGKVETKITKGNTDHFYRHSNASARYADDWLSTYCFRNVIKHQIVFLVKYHDLELAEMKDSTLYKYIDRGGLELMMLLLIIQKCDIMAQNIRKGERLEIIDAQSERIRKLHKRYFVDEKIVLNGSHLKEWGFEPGIIFKRILKDVGNKVVDGELENDIDSIESYVRDRYTGNN